jgi:hypothetical protein
MDCSPKALIDLARCTDSCIPSGMMGASQIAAACAWANAASCTLPTAPVDLGASAGDSQVILTWSAGVGATGYNIKRALVTGGPYTVIGTSAASPYVDLTAVNGTTYYYVVSSTNACGESAGNSLESNATPFIFDTVILPDGSGGFWRVIVDLLGDVYTQSDPGPATPDVILADGGGGFWKLTASVAGDRYGVSNAGPATVAPVILDANLVAWTLTVDALGDITATS